MGSIRLSRGTSRRRSDPITWISIHVRTGHDPEIFGGAAILSGYISTYPVRTRRLACVIDIGSVRLRSFHVLAVGLPPRGPRASLTPLQHLLLDERSRI
jgi:hypothetical protein